MPGLSRVLWVITVRLYFDAVGRDDTGGVVTLVGIVVVLLPAVRKMISSPALACRLSPALSRLRANSKNP